MKVVSRRLQVTYVLYPLKKKYIYKKIITYSRLYNAGITKMRQQPKYMMYMVICRIIIVNIDDSLLFIFFPQSIR